MIRAACALLGGALLAGCASRSLPEPSDHPLVDRVVSSENATLLEPDAMLDRMAESDVVLLGEKHDNPWHHAIERRVLEGLLARGRRPVLGLEVLSVEQTSAAMRFVTAKDPAHHGRDPTASLRAALGWGRESDWHWDAYGPLLELAREHGLTVFGADLPVGLRRRVAQVGVDGLTGVERALIPNAPAPEARYAALMRTRIRAAHCGHGSDAYLERLLENWVARNETMARAIASMLEASDGDGPVVLVVGAEHTRHGLGVPARVAQLRAAATQLNLGMREVAPGRLQAAEYTAETSFEGRTFPADHPYLWFTPASPEPDGDPCAALRHTGS